MKIQSVSFRNINSLAGEFSVDFTDPALTDSGIFLITGPTGSGKSTLLDAISFALYGCTPRQKKISDKGNEIMSRHFAECRAEVRFEHEGQCYIVSAEQKRRKGALPFGPMQRRLERLHPDGRAELLADSIKEVKAGIESITNMPDVEAFCRCMLLAQGECARLLNMEEKDRAALLSVITQTEVYSDIGERLVARAEQAKREVEERKEEPTLAAEERNALEKAISTQTAEQAKLLAAADSCKTALLHLDEAARRQQDYDKAEGDRRQALAAEQSFRETGKAARLDAALRAAAIEPTEARRAEETAQRRRAEAQLETTRRELAALNPQLQAAEAAYRSAERAAKEQLPQLAEARRRVQQELRPAEQKLAADLARAQELQRRAQAAAKAQEQAADRCRKTAAEIAELTQQQAESRRALQELAPYARLGESLADIKVCLHAWGRHESSCNNPLPAVKELETQLDEEQQHKAALLGTHTPDFYLHRAEALAALQKVAQLLQEQEHRQAESAATKYRTTEALAALAAPLAKAREQLETCRRNESNIRSLADIQVALDECYQKFLKGDYEVCPCCGSPTPGHRRSVGESELQRAVQLTEAAEQALREQEHQERELQRRLADAEGRLAGLEKEIAHLRRRRSDALQALGEEALPAQLDERIAADRRIAEEGAAVCAAISRTEEQLATARDRDALHAALRPFAAELPDTCRAAAESVQALETKAAAYERLTKGQSILAARLEERGKAQETETAAAQQAEAACERDRQEAEKQAALCAEQQESIRRNWGGKSADALEQEHTAAEQALREAESRAQKSSHTLTQKLAALRSRQQEQTRRLEEAQHAEAELLTALTRLLTEHAFADETAYGAAKLPEAERAALQTEQSALREARVAAESRAQALAKALREHREAHPATEDRDTLLARRKALAATRAELEEQLNANRTALAVDDLSREKNRHLLAEKQELRERAESWQLLRAVLGGTKESFQKYAQAITFDALIASANAHLHRLFPRFLLRQDRSKGTLGLNVIDLCLSDTEARHVSNLSGGETFIVSLAMALGLSGLTNSRVSIDTIFLDEGFGTLDPENLRRVLDVLEQLKQEGKLIGIITHVEELKEKFPPTCNIQVEKLGDTGYSTLSPENPAVTAAPASFADRGTTPKRRRKKKEEAA